MEKKNPWVGQNVAYFIDFFKAWFTFLPLPPGDEKEQEEGGLGYIGPFTYFYLNNPIAFYFLNQFKSGIDGKNQIFNWTVKFLNMRGDFMDSPLTKEIAEQWCKDPAIKIDEYEVPPSGKFESFNAFFIRKFKDVKKFRPTPKDESALCAPADSEINFIQADLTLETKLSVKTRQINVGELLRDPLIKDPKKSTQSKYAKHFVGGTAVSCVLMPSSYHHYHSPVDGRIVESREVPGIYNGIMDGEHWFNKGNIGQSTTDFSIFEDFHRAYFIITTQKYGHVGIIPVGLNTISSINFAIKYDEIAQRDRSTRVEPGQGFLNVERGDELGYFAYGGSLNILLFEPGVFDAMSVLMGQRMGTLNESQKRQ